MRTGLRRRYSICITDTNYAVVDPTGDSASGRTEQDILFLKKIIKRIMLPQANRAFIG